MSAQRALHAGRQHRDAFFADLSGGPAPHAGDPARLTDVPALLTDVPPPLPDVSALLPDVAAKTGLRSLITESWLRSAAAGLDPDGTPPEARLEDPQLRDYRAEHRLSQVFPLLYDVLGRAAEDCDSMMTVADAQGRLLWVCGTPAVLRRAEQINFVAGSVWDERSAGTNAPGTALHLDQAVQIHGWEHFNRLVQPWSCAAAPIHDPLTHQILGLVDVTGGDDVGSPQTLAMVRAAARMAESELGRIAAVAGRWISVAVPQPDAPSPLRLLGLGRAECVLDAGSGPRHLSQRHSEILIALVDHPEGLTAEQLELEVYAADVHSSTMRAEMTRLRALLGSSLLTSRPYRLVAELDCDWRMVTAHLAAGRPRQALSSYAGPLLPGSDAPGVVARRHSIQAELRAAVLTSGQPELMIAWTRSRWGATDLDVWQRQATVLPTGSPLRALAVAEVRRLEREFAAPARQR